MEIVRVPGLVKEEETYSMFPSETSPVRKGEAVWLLLSDGPDTWYFERGKVTPLKSGYLVQTSRGETYRQLERDDFWINLPSMKPA